MRQSARMFPALALIVTLALVASTCGGGGGGGGKPTAKNLGFRIVDIDPADGALFVELDAEVVATFSDPISLGTISEDNFLVEERASGRGIPGSVSLRAGNRVAAFTPAGSYLKNTHYRVRVLPDVTSIARDTLEEQFVSFFTTEIHTEPPPPPPPPQPRGKIRPVEDMLVGRSSHRATLLGNGEVLVTGGFDTSSTVTAVAEVFDPKKEEFNRAKTGLNDARGFHTATRLTDGRVLVLGGVGSDLNESDSAELYDPVTGNFAKLTGRMVKPRAFHTATLLADGRVLVAGGTVPTPTGVYSSRTAEIYDQGSFATLPDMAVYRAAHTATVLADGRVLLVGGNGTDARVEVFDPAKDSFRTLAGQMRLPRRGHTTSLLGDGNVLVMGGGDRSAELYVTEKDYFRWTNGFPIVERKDHTATPVGGGRILLAAGSHQQGQTVFFSRTTEIFDPASGVFLGNGPVLANPTTRHRATTLADGGILITGGSNLDPTLPELRTAEIYSEEEEE